MTVVFWSDVGCPWATLAAWRWHEACGRAGVDVPLDHRSFPLELLNRRPTPKLVLDAEVPVVGTLAPGFGFRVWSAPAHEWPVTTLPAVAAVQAAKAQSLALSTALDLALRRALFADSRCISMRHVVLDVAATVDGLDVDALDLCAGEQIVVDDLAVARTDAVQGSPHVFVHGEGVHNPGIELRWEGKPGEGGYPVVDVDEPSIWDALVSRAAGSS
jgi:predicted DsbA family dithiol-disulfide isomerase